MPDQPLRLAIAQARSSPGDVAANAAASARIVIAARERGAELVVFPELSLTGYELPLLEATPAAWVTRDDARLEPVRRACCTRGSASMDATESSSRGSAVTSRALLWPRIVSSSVPMAGSSSR